jgi:hypothetical protein
MRSADDCVGSVGGTDQFGRAERDHLEVALLIDDEVVRLEISHHDLLGHEVLKQQDHGGSLELGIEGTQ